MNTDEISMRIKIIHDKLEAISADMNQDKTDSTLNYSLFDKSIEQIFDDLKKALKDLKTHT